MKKLASVFFGLLAQSIANAATFTNPAPFSYVNITPTFSAGENVAPLIPTTGFNQNSNFAVVTPNTYQFELESTGTAWANLISNGVLGPYEASYTNFAASFEVNVLPGFQISSIYTGAGGIHRLEPNYIARVTGGVSGGRSTTLDLSQNSTNTLSNWSLASAAAVYAANTTSVTGYLTY
jgi:hypothetical protein